MRLRPCRDGLPKWCGAFEGCHVRNIAVIGNGPLSAQQRSELNSGRFQVTVRFNYLNNRWEACYTLHVRCVLPVLVLHFSTVTAEARTQGTCSYLLEPLVVKCSVLYMQESRC